MTWFVREGVRMRFISRSFVGHHQPCATSDKGACPLTLGPAPGREIGLQLPHDRCEVGPHLIFRRVGLETLDAGSLQQGLCEFGPRILDDTDKLVFRIGTEDVAGAVSLEREVRRKDDRIQEEANRLCTGLPLNVRVSHGLLMLDDSSPRGSVAAPEQPNANRELKGQGAYVKETSYASLCAR